MTWVSADVEVHVMMSLGVSGRGVWLAVSPSRRRQPVLPLGILLDQLSWLKMSTVGLPGHHEPLAPAVVSIWFSPVVTSQGSCPP